MVWRAGCKLVEGSRSGLLFLLLLSGLLSGKERVRVCGGAV